MKKFLIIGESNDKKLGIWEKIKELVCWNNFGFIFLCLLSILLPEAPEAKMKTMYIIPKKKFWLIILKAIMQRSCLVFVFLLWDDGSETGRGYLKTNTKTNWICCNKCYWPIISTFHSRCNSNKLSYLINPFHLIY